MIIPENEMICDKIVWSVGLQTFFIEEILSEEIVSEELDLSESLDVNVVDEIETVSS